MMERLFLTVLSVLGLLLAILLLLLVIVVATMSYARPMHRPIQHELLVKHPKVLNVQIHLPPPRRNATTTVTRRRPHP